ncbi:hypothetical protein [Verrucosispora sp. TAA-831]|uniref:hypothetical protein n=1 Tax=Verrucosispora sp. TAA-831 TaxID=3422227 RepID=UPI003D6FB4ED
MAATTAAPTGLALNLSESRHEAAVMARPLLAHKDALARRREGYAAKFAAETVSAEPPRYVAPTDAAFAATFAHCVGVPATGEYPAIREAFERLFAVGGETVELPPAATLRRPG